MDLKKSSALANLGWPFNLIKQEGMLNWSIREFEPSEAFGQILVSYRDNAIKAFANIRDDRRKSLLDTKLEWSIKGEHAVQAKAWVDGKESDFAVALELFQSALSRAEEPIFTPMGVIKPLTKTGPNL